MSTSEIANFCKFLWGDTEGLVYFPTRDASNDWRKRFFRWPEHLPNLVKSLQLWSAEGKEVFVSPVLYKDSAFEHKSIDREHVLGSHVLWADFDGTAPAEWPAEPTGDRPTPSLRIQSSTPDRQHAYWRLDKLETDLEAIETKNRSLAYLLDADTSGWDISQLLRPPGTVNHGYSKPERKGKTYEVVTEDTTGFEYQLDFFDPRPILSEKSGANSWLRKYPMSFKYSHDTIFLSCFPSDSLRTQLVSQTGQPPIARLVTLVQRRDLMTRRFILSSKPSMTAGVSTSTAGIATNA